MRVRLREAIDYVIEHTPDKKKISENIKKVKKLFLENATERSGLEWLPTNTNGLMYIHDMRIAQEWAHLNRYVIAYKIAQNMGWVVSDCIETVHNYLGEDNIIRKSAVSARNGERMIIPLNMRDGSVICVGRGNSDWNNSAPHGAGRRMSRKQARNFVSLEDYKNTMGKVWTTCVSDNTIDEAPMAYKDSTSILNQITETCIIKDKLNTLYNFKASE